MTNKIYFTSIAFLLFIGTMITPSINAYFNDIKLSFLLLAEWFTFSACCFLLIKSYHIMDQITKNKPAE